jgi:plasmid stability protein
MVDILVRDVDRDTARLLKAKATAKGASLSETAREALAAYVKPSKEEAWAKIDAIRKKIGRVSVDSTADIREDRDSR